MHMSDITATSCHKPTPKQPDHNQTHTRKRSSDSTMTTKIACLETKELVEIDGYVFKFIVVLGPKGLPTNEMGDLHREYKLWMSKTYPDVKCLGYMKFKRDVDVLND